MQSSFSTFLYRFLCLAAILICPVITHAQKQISVSDFREDLTLLKAALKELHPGLYRYTDEDDLDNAFNDAVDVKTEAISLGESFLRISEFVAKTKCGHTIVNPYNQNDKIANELFEGRNKLPFTFSFVNGSMTVERDLSGAGIESGSQILSINGTAAEDLLKWLLRYSDGDGSNDGQRIYNCSVTGKGSYEFFDLYFPFKCPPVSGKFEIGFTNSKSRAGYLNRTVDAVTRQERSAKLKNDDSGSAVDSGKMWELKFLRPEIAKLRLSTFVMYNSDFDWKGFLYDAFDKIHQSKAGYLLIDIRGNAGGSTEVVPELISYICNEPMYLASERFVSYETVSEQLRPYLSTWDNSFFDRTGSVEKYDDRLFRLKHDAVSSVSIVPKDLSYKGKVYLLTDESNSSATFLLASILKEKGLATLAGRTTGGNLRGITGGNLFFLDLPKTGIEVDIPLITTYPTREIPDSGLEPHIKIERNVSDISEGRDTDVEHILKLIDGN